MQKKVLDEPGDLPGKSATAAREAREQAEAYESVFAPTPLELDDGTVLQIPPHPDFGMLDDEQMGEYEELLFEVEGYDHEDDLPEQHLDSGITLPGERGALKRPYRKDGALVKPRIRCGWSAPPSVKPNTNGYAKAANQPPTCGESGANKDCKSGSVKPPTPKVLEALWLWRQFPRQIASDLSRFHRRRIAEWHQGAMSSYELLELLEFMPEEGALGKAVRCGEFSESQKVWRFIATELSKLRAGYHAVHGGEKYVPKVFLTLAEYEEMVDDAESAEQSREAVFWFQPTGPARW